MAMSAPTADPTTLIRGASKEIAPGRAGELVADATPNVFRPGLVL